MRPKQRLNGCDYLMLGFDHELRRLGFSGNSCQIVLELGSAISADKLRQRLETLQAAWPIMRARPCGVLVPKWKMPRAAAPAPRIRFHRHDPELRQRLFNEPIAANDGELMRFDLVERDGGRMDVIFTWAHSLMDARSAEYFLAVVGREELALPDMNAQPPARRKHNLRNRFKLAWKNLHQLDAFCKAAPKSLGARRPNAPSQVHHRIDEFTAEETEQIRAQSVKHCGALRDAQYHAAVGVVELHRLHQRLNFQAPATCCRFPSGCAPRAG